MTSSELAAKADPDVVAPRQPQVLEGQWVGELRSDKGKLKGIRLLTSRGEMSIKLPKYLRPMLVRSLQPGSFLRVWVSPKKGTWEALNLIPLLPGMDISDWQPPSLTPAPAGADPVQPAPACLQICRKGSCYKHGSSEVYRAAEAAIAAEPELSHVHLEATGCLKACKQGPAVRLAGTGQVLTRMTPQKVIALLAAHKIQPEPLT